MNEEVFNMTIPRQEYPRPQFERKEWMNLNGKWTCAFDFSRSGTEKGWAQTAGFEQTITVPFCPESRLSGVGFTDFIEVMWYHRKLEIDGRKLEAERWVKCIDLTQEGGTFQHEYEVFTLTYDQIKEELL